MLLLKLKFVGLITIHPLKGVSRMSAEYIRLLATMGADNIIKDLVSNHMLGVGVWNLTKKQFNVLENITGHSKRSYTSLIEFIEEICEPFDVEVVVAELNHYMQDPQGDYQSTFRLRVKGDSSRWVSLKGNKVTASSTADELFYVVMLNVSGGNFVTGNDRRTNLLDDDFFLKKVEHNLAVEPLNENLVLIRMAIKNFQQIKEKYELDIIIQLVKKIAKRLKNIFSESSDITRFSNDIYLAMVTHLDSRAEIKKLTDSIIDTFREPFVIENNFIEVKMSLGVTDFPNKETSVANLILQSEFATRQSKNIGEYATTFFDSDLAEEFKRQLIIENDLHQAVEDDAILPFFQPQFNSNTNRLIGIEVLARWKHEELGYISPEKFIQVAEKQGLMSALGRSILEKSLRIASKWLDKDYDIGVLSVNVSPTELIDPQFLPNLLKLCEKYQYPHERLEIEITEGIFIDAIGHRDKIIDELDNNGFKIAVDDFGVGYSNLSFISNTKLDTLKIDKTLTDQLTDKEGLIVVEAVVSVAQRLNYKVIPEGVETRQQVLLLSQINCNNIQGYYYSRPLPEDEMETYLKKESE